METNIVMEKDTKSELLKDEVVNEEVKRRGRPRKYATEEESKAMKLKQIRESYERNYDRYYEKKYDGKDKQKRGRKPKYATIEDFREAERQRYMKKKALKNKVLDSEDLNEINE
jgi:hypothetical protein